ncbi:hypothetical protein D9758_012812 [Tetrapyrgos nigripes]|uniref:Phosphoglycerate mutase-like protein n=1 Tax=Tetrapyrgos nigripes TaxID=182062 RepID=A0A8H5CYD1_9AGAR|nr:hypothetical protein D9758_012812 [Tetrapyrgos nigripes]
MVALVLLISFGLMVVGTSVLAESFQPLHHSGPASPYFRAPPAAGVPRRLPDGCVVEQAAWFVRHGSRYPEPGSFTGWQNLFAKFQNSTYTARGPLAFIPSWTLPVDDEPHQPLFLSSTGAGEAFALGVSLRKRYGFTKGGENITIWTAGQQRVVDTAVYFTRGYLSAGNYLDEPSSNRGNFVVLVDSATNTTFADSLTPSSSCPAYGVFGGNGSATSNAFRATFQQDIAGRLNEFLDGLVLGTTDIGVMQDLCGFGYEVSGDHRFCDIFTENEWLDYEYAHDLNYYYGSGPGNPLSATVGYPWVKAIADIFNVGPGKMVENGTLIPPPLIMGFSHDNNVPPLISALGLWNSSDTSPLPVTRRESNHQFRSSHLVSFLGNVALERMTCVIDGPSTSDARNLGVFHTANVLGGTVVNASSNGTEEVFVRVLANEAVIPIPTCHSGPGASCPLEQFVGYVNRERKEASGDFVQRCGLEGVEGAVSDVRFLTTTGDGDMLLVDLRGTDLEPSQIPPPYKIWSPAQLDASIRERLCYPTPLNDSLSSLLELCTRPQHTQIFSSPSVYRLYIDCLRHISQGSNYIGRSHPNQSAVKRGNTVVTLKSVNSVDTDAHPYSIPAHRRPTLLLGSGDSNRKPPAPLLNPMDEALMNNIAAEEVTADRSRMAALRIHTRHRSRSDDFSPPRDFLLLPRNEYSAARHYQSRARGPSLTRPGKSKARTSRAVSSPEPLILYRVPPSWDDLIDIQAREDGKVASESSSQTTTLGITSVPSGSKKNSSNSTASIRNTDKARMMLERQRELAVKKRKIESPFGSSSSFPIFSGSATSLESSGRRRPEYVKANQAVVMPSFNGMTDRAKVTVGAKLASGSSGVNEKYASPFRRVSHSMVDKKFTAAATTSTQTSTTPATPSSSSRDSGTYTTPIRSVNHTTMSGGVSSTGKQLKPISTIPIPELPEEEKKKLRARASLDSSARSGSTSAGKKGRGSLPGNGSSSGKWKSGDGTSGDIRSMIRNMGSKAFSYLYPSTSFPVLQLLAMVSPNSFLVAPLRLILLLATTFNLNFAHSYALAVPHYRHSLHSDVIAADRRATHKTHEAHKSTKAQTQGNLTFVENSGICETTDGVGQVSGYVNVEDDSSFWFWFFESRNNPDTDPFTLWLNGGPGCTSMIGLFTEHGPCRINEDRNSTSINPYSWNNFTNILYLDQPFGAGYSTGVEVDSSVEAAKYVWQFFQVLWTNDRFSQYKDRQFILATESFGAHFGPTFIKYFNEKNDLIDSGKLDAEKVAVTHLMINNGKHDSEIGFQSLIDFVTDAPGYGQLAKDDVIEDIKNALPDCSESLQQCNSRQKSDKADDFCNEAIINCTRTIFTPAVGTHNPDFLLSKEGETDNFTDTHYGHFIRLEDVQKAIGADANSPNKLTFDQCDSGVKARFSKAGGTARSGLPDLAELANTGMSILVWGGDADLKANWLGIHESMIEMDWYGNLLFGLTPLSNLTMGGEDVGRYKIVQNLTFAVVNGAGHALTAYKPDVSQMIFSQFATDQPLHSV